MKKLSEILEGMFDVDWGTKAEGFSKFAHYINTIKSEGEERSSASHEVYLLKKPEFSVEDIWELIKDKAIKKISRSNIQKGKCYAELANTGIYLLNCRNIKDDTFKEAVGPAATILKVLGRNVNIELNVFRDERSGWGTKGYSISKRETYEIPDEIFDIITK